MSRVKPNAHTSLDVALRNPTHTAYSLSGPYALSVRKEDGYYWVLVKNDATRTFEAHGPIERKELPRVVNRYGISIKRHAWHAAQTPQPTRAGMGQTISAAHLRPATESLD